MEYKVEELIESISKTHTFPNNEIIFLNTSDIEKGYVLHRNYSETKSLPGQAKKSIQKGDILYSEIRPKNERYAYIDFECENYVVSTKLMVLRNKKPKTLNTRFFYLYITSRTITNTLQNLAESRSGTFPQITFSEVKKLQIKLPNLTVQNKIVKTIESINQKIVTNQKIIANLEELSQTLFKRWFVDFEFSDENGNPYKSSGGEMVDSELGEIPKSWTVKNLDDIANYVNGLAMQKYKHVDDKLSLPVVKIKELKNGSTDENSNRCTSNIPEKALINDGDIIFSWSATLLVKMWCGGEAGLNQHLFKVSSDKYPKWFYYYWTKRYIDYFIGIAKDKATTMGHINRKHLSHAKILIPNDQTLEMFSRTFNELLEKELNVSKESKRLIELRDTLLPKLMSGEIEIPDDIEVNEDELSI
ncbi:restriction endonuclease subunit S [Mammaliicoccus lentus]|uniref:restriction endonuclease subunit S n=1 Tax=Mammaliicoccus lentus TaxID=42858 RepID=UPI00214BD55F|nr:restriction endonuclease subunit S [Mammaliicoccus lentus]MCR1872005.1 restriction endonuclease subunit S [Mammaliicoccus lentus]